MNQRTSADMPSLVFSANWDKYYKQINRLTYNSETRRIPYYFTFIKVGGMTITPSFVLELVVKKLCHPSKPKFNSGSNTCSAVTTCTNAILCSDENIPIICSANYLYDPDTNPNPQCNNVCSLRKGRGPMSDKTKAFCNRKCDDNMLKCQNVSSAETQNIYDNNTCPAGFDRYGYKCINQSVTSKSNIIYIYILILNSGFKFLFELKIKLK